MKKKFQDNKIRVLFFIGALDVGGKERRLIELMHFLKQSGKYEMKVVVTRPNAPLPKFSTLNIEMIQLKSSPIAGKLNYVFDFYKIVKSFRPHLIHTWGRMQTLYAIPASLLSKIKLVNGQITDAPPKRSFIHSQIDRINFKFSEIILSNSHAGLQAFHPPLNKALVIYNGLDLNRFTNLADKESVRKRYDIRTKYLILMVANFSPRKDYETFFRIGNLVTKNRQDITWMGVGYMEEGSDLVKKCREIIGDSPFVRMHQQIFDVEALINCSDIGVRFSNENIHGEGISNSIIEYMALEKPVVANEAGGTREVVLHNDNGYLINGQSDEEVRDLILGLVGNKDLTQSFGRAGRSRIEQDFSLSAMGQAFCALYYKVLRRSAPNT